MKEIKFKKGIPYEYNGSVVIYIDEVKRGSLVLNFTEDRKISGMNIINKEEMTPITDVSKYPFLPGFMVSQIKRENKVIDKLAQKT